MDRGPWIDPWLHECGYREWKTRSTEHTLHQYPQSYYTTCEHILIKTNGGNTALRAGTHPIFRMTQKG